MKLTEDRVVHDTVYRKDGVEVVLLKTPLTINEWNKILKNQELREQIVDLADIWDGKESIKYGHSLQNILRMLGINDIPKFYKTYEQTQVEKTNDDRF